MMFLVAGGVMSSYVGLVLQAILAAMLQVLRRHMRTRLKYGSATDNDVWLSWFIVLRNSKASFMFFFQFKNSSVEGNSLSTSGLDEPVAVVDRESGRKVSI